jgi:hypothetical protein
MPDAGVPADALGLVEATARAVRTEVGEEVDAYPGYRAPEQADPLNRAFIAIARDLLEPSMAGAPAAQTVDTRALRLAAERRLAAEGWDAGQVRSLTEREPGSPDDRVGFLLRSSRAQVE